MQDHNPHMTMAHTYFSEAWESWLKCFGMQTGTEYNICTGKNVNKEANTGVLEMNGKLLAYKVIWQKQYMCHRGGKPRYNSSDKATQCTWDKTHRVQSNHEHMAHEATIRRSNSIYIISFKELKSKKKPKQPN